MKETSECRPSIDLLFNFKTKVLTRNVESDISGLLLNEIITSFLSAGAVVGANGIGVDMKC